MDSGRHAHPNSLTGVVRRSLSDYGDWAFAATVVAGFASAMLSSQWPNVGGLAPLLIGLGVVLLLLGTLGFDYVELAQRRWLTTLYFVAMVGLCAAILALSPSITFIVIIILPVVAHAVSMLRWWGVVLVSAALLGFYGAVVAARADLTIALQATVSTASGLVFVALFTHLALREERARREVERLAGELREANHKLREYAAQVDELATARERNRIAREIHDGLGHYLTVINMQIQAARAVQASDPTRAAEAMGKAGAMAHEALADVRRSVSALRASPLDNKSLVESIQVLAEGSRAGGIQTEFVVLGPARPLPPQVDLTLYRAAQEALTNVRKHARASAVDLSLHYEPGRVRLVVQDNGIGSERADGGFGLLGVRERTQLLHGQVTVRSGRGQGYQLEVSIPDDGGVA